MTKNDLLERVERLLSFVSGKESISFWTTSSNIPWSWIEESRGTMAITDRERVNLLLKAANRELLSKGEWEHLCGAPLTSILPAWAKEPPGQADLAPVLEEMREPLRRALTKAVRGRGTPNFGQRLGAYLDCSIIKIPEMSEDGEHRDRVIARSPGSAVIYALSLVYDSTKRFGSELQMCALPECGKFVLVPRPKTRGNPRNFYCCAGHEDTYRRRLAAERQTASRERISVVTLRKRKERNTRS